MENGRVGSPVVLPIKLTPSQVRPVAYRIMSKKHGLNLKSAALDVLASFLGNQFGADWRGAKAERFMDDLAKLWKDDDRGVFVDGEPLSRLIANLVNAQLSQANSETSERRFNFKDYFKVVNAQSQRQISYNHIKKHFELSQGGAPGRVLGPPNALVHIFPTRFHLLSDRIHRNDQFQARSYQNNEESFVITKIKNLLGREKQEFFLFGHLLKNEDEWWLLDNSGKIRLEFTPESTYAPGHYFTDGSFVLCYGVPLGDYFQVGTLGPPTVERREQTKDAYGNIDFYGITSSISSRLERIDPDLEEILVAEEQRLDHRIILLGGDVYLDRRGTLDSLRNVLREISKNPPLILVIPGSFCSKPFQIGDTSSYREAMNAFANILQGLPDLTSKTKIIMVPGENDPWQAMSSKGGTQVWPLEPIPKLFTGRVERAAPDIVFASNPCRICYLSQEIVISRDNFGQMLRHNSLPSALTASLDTTNGHHVEETVVERGEILDLDEDMSSQRALMQMQSENDILPRHVDSVDSDESEVRKVIATILDQCHLSPFSLSVRPVVWEYDMSLSLIQWPSSLILIDSTTPRFKNTYEGCQVSNPGSFIQNNKGQWLDIKLGRGQSELMSLTV
ncbi:DNA polymerase epsilon subunit B [Wickerhamiella sorbophila]|uniref:DNA polymerase epsilon subunit B n=1 Tax=Wickerhamiella sorbophila TaxID=45607 RepID=A0A2T0FEM2_9ASCO|nr:DNA polymerase epsilon subunit B [Wickerhamiella sorbophila]PRT53409.1 DNA polymerase epsilon subunit B [Wickerhamiella sorbophila]